MSKQKPLPSKKKGLKEPLSLRLSDQDNPQRGERFFAVLEKRSASAASVIKNLVDAYIESDGREAAPWVVRDAASTTKDR